MLTKEQLLKIAELNLSDIIEEMDKRRFSEYCTILDLFIKSIPFLEKEMKDALSINGYDSLARSLTNVVNTLSMMHADDLAKDWLKLAREINDSKPKSDVIEAYFTYLMTATLTLAADIKNMSCEDENDEVLEEAGITDKHKKKILAVDDSALTLNSLKLILQDTEFKLTCVNSGETAQRYLLNNSPDLIILDVEMPEMNGYELAEIIREKGHYAPIIFLTGNASMDYVFKAIQAGAVDFIVKPINKDIVLEKVRQYMA